MCISIDGKLDTLLNLLEKDGQVGDLGGVLLQTLREEGVLVVHINGMWMIERLNKVTQDYERFVMVKENDDFMLMAEWV